LQALESQCEVENDLRARAKHEYTGLPDLLEIGGLVFWTISVNPTDPACRHELDPCHRRRTKRRRDGGCARPPSGDGRTKIPSADLDRLCRHALELIAVEAYVNLAVKHRDRRGDRAHGLDRSIAGASSIE